MSSFCQLYSTWAQIKGAYRFIENPQITPKPLEEASVNFTLRTCCSHKIILSVSDTTSLNFTNHRATQGLGPIDQATIKGILSHNSIALGLDGVPLGILRHQAWVRDPEDYGKAKTRAQRNIEEKESYRWVQCVQDIAQKFNALEQDRPYLIHVFDREGDIYEVFQTLESTGDGAVIRSSHNRKIQGEQNLLHDQVRLAPTLGKALLEIPRKHNEPKRQASVSYRACPVVLKSKKKQNPDIKLNMVAVLEENPPQNVAPLEWFLITTESIESLKDVLEVVRIYKLRWRIEEYHLILKSGCRIEKVQFEQADRIIKVLALLSTVALRLLALTYKARVSPDLPCTELLSEAEWKALYTQIQGRPPTQTQAPPSLKQAFLWIGSLGGHVGRKSDGMPGVRSLWKGWRDLQLLTTLYVACMNHSTLN